MSFFSFSAPPYSCGICCFYFYIAIWKLVPCYFAASRTKMNQNNLEHKQLKIKQKYFLHVGANNQIQVNTKKFGESRLFFFLRLQYAWVWTCLLLISALLSCFLSNSDTYQAWGMCLLSASSSVCPSPHFKLNWSAVSSCNFYHDHTFVSVAVIKRCSSPWPLARGFCVCVV